MKKLVTMILVLTYVLGLAGCGQQQTQEEDANGQDYFDAAVLEVYDTYILAECLEVTSGAILSGTQVNVSTDVVTAKGIPEIEVGDSIRVVFTGIAESDPASLSTVFAVYLLDENGTPIDLSEPG